MLAHTPRGERRRDVFECVGEVVVVVVMLVGGRAGGGKVGGGGWRWVVVV